MNKILAYYNQLATPNAPDSIPRTDMRKLIILNKVHLIGVLICIVYGFLFLGLDILLFAISSFFNAILSFSVYYFGKRTMVNLTKWMSLVIASSQVTFYGIILNVSSGVGLMLFYILTLIFYIFDKKSSIFLALGVLLISCSLLAVSDLMHWQYHFLTFETSLKILPLSIICSFLMVTFILAIIRDDKNELDKELITNNNILELNNHILIESNTINKRLLSVISHDVRSPIASLQGFLNLIAHKSIDLQDQNKLLETLSEKTKSINQLIEDILFWTSQQEKSRSAHFKKVSVTKELDSILSLYSYELRNKNLTVVKSIKEEEDFITDRDILAFSVRNVMSNAIKYSPEGAEISVKIDVNGDHTSIQIENSGNIDDQLLNSIFQKQVQSMTGTINEKGFGLGLYLCSIYLKSIESSIEIKRSKPNCVCIDIELKNFLN
jgi:signal transduction histidine kinase